MRMVILVAALAASTAGAASATTWVASCNDGKNIQYVQTIKGTGYLYLKTSVDYFQTARLAQSFASDTVLCGAVQGNAQAGNLPVTQICIDKSQRIISLKYRNPNSTSAEAVEAGVFCSATVTERATNLTER